MVKFIFKRLISFLKNTLSISKNKDTNFLKLDKKSLLQKKREEIMETVSFEKRSPHSYELQRKLALLVSNIDKIDKRDIIDLEHRKYGNSNEDDLLTSYRIDFRNKDDLEIFKRKYKEYIL